MLGAAQSFGAANTSVSTTLTAPTTTASGSGDLLVAAIKVRDTTSLATVTGVTDSASNTWARAAAVTQGTQADGEIWYATGAASVSNVTVTVTGASALALTVLDVAGASPAPLDKTAVLSGSSATPSTGTTTATAQANEIAVGGIGWNGTATPSGQTAGYTPTAVRQSTASGAATGEQAAWKILTAAGTQTYGAALSSSIAWTGAIATFKVGTSPLPTISSFSPTSGAVATPVVINGTNFTGATVVKFNVTTQPTFTVNSDIKISTTVPTGATTGAIHVTTPGGTANSSTNFTVTSSPLPTISSFSPTSGAVATPVVINGTNFTGATVVKFNLTTQPTFTVTSDIKISTTVPTGATTGAIHVTTPGGTANSSTNFTVTSSPPHVMVIVMENQESTSIIGSVSAPYINSLATQYRSATQWYAVQHNSPTDYLDLLAGSDLGLPNGKPYSVPTLVDELHAGSIPWRGYMESMPSNCFTGTTADGLYDPIHNPFHYFTNYSSASGGWCNSANLSTEGVLPYPGSSGLVSALTGSNAPDFVWITPNDCNNMHGDPNTGSTCKVVTGAPLIKAGDTWLSSNIGPVISSSWFSQNGIIIITWDEGTSGKGCCGLTAPGGHIATIVVTSKNKGLGNFTATGDHYGTLRGIEESYGVVPLLGGSANIANGDLKNAF